MNDFDLWWHIRVIRMCFEILNIKVYIKINILDPLIFSAPEPKAQVHYCDHALSVVRPSICLSVRPSLTFHIFDFSSETTEQNSTKLDRKQELNILNQVCVFLGRSEKQDGRPGLWLAETFSTSSETAERNSTKLDRNQDLNIPCQVCVFWADRKTRWPPWPLIGWDIFDFSSETAERNSTKLDRKQDLNVSYQVCVFRADRKNKMAALASDWPIHFQPPLKPLNEIQRNLTGSKISTSSTKFVFFGPIGKTRWPPWRLIGWDIFDFSSETAEGNITKLDRKQDLNVLCQVCVLRADQ